MIKVEITDRDFRVSKLLGEFNPKEIKDLVELVAEHGVIYKSEEYKYYTSHYDMDLGYYSIIIRK